MELAHKILGAGDPLVILHGLFGTLDNWQTVGKRLAEHRQVVLVDLPNHGRSPHVDAADYETQAAALAEFLTAHWMHRADVLGHSMGGKVAMRYALNYPDRVRKLVVVDMAPRAYERGHDDILAAMASVPVEADLTRQQVDELLAARIGDAGVRLFLMKNLARDKAGGFRWKLNLDVLQREYARVLEAVSGTPWPGEALFVRGSRSAYVRDEDWPATEALFPAAQLATVEGAGHWVHAERPAALTALVEDFLGGG